MIREANEAMLSVHPHVPLRTLDAIHLATYQSVITGPLFTKDKRMRDAAKLLGLAVVE
jgi:predicted nucleic acid-binding protein